MYYSYKLMTADEKGIPLIITVMAKGIGNKALRRLCPLPWYKYVG